MPNRRGAGSFSTSQENETMAVFDLGGVYAAGKSVAFCRGHSTVSTLSFSRRLG